MSSPVRSATSSLHILSHDWDAASGSLKAFRKPIRRKLSHREVSAVLIDGLSRVLSRNTFDFFDDFQVLL
jgi:hypothetical protein